LKILALDFSKSSLAYAVRMARRLDVGNVEFLHGDILDLPSLGRGFSVIESVGVLHHMNDPFDGWRVLTDLLHPGGMMKLGLYSEKARGSLDPVREKIRGLKLRPIPDDLRELRRRILLGEEDLPSPPPFRDFYQLNEFRDLVFHVMEHRFTIPQIAGNLKTLGLEFVGFEFNKDLIARRYTEHCPQDPGMTDLSCWAAFEERNPDTFSGMYQFWCQKPAVR
jgi:SAM-dependent methyltransferase